MKLAFSTLSCPAWDRKEVIDNASRLGFDGIEWRLLDGKIIGPDLPENTAAELGRLTAEAGLRVPALDSSIDLAAPPGEQRAKLLADTERMLTLARRFGASYLRVFPGAHPPEAGSARWLREAVDALAPAVRATGVTLALELHDSRDSPGVRGRSCSDFLTEALDGVPTDIAGVQWDVANPYLEDETADTTWRNISGRLLYVQFKDMARDGSAWRYVLTGEGDLPLRDILGWLRDDGFDGWISLEWEKFWNPQIAEPELALPGFLEFMKEYR
ncbi:MULTISPECIES: sugar phosphate isomerase/epimerase family protein [unclassified Micromonospora]|uniref:sugar phosphate isomerase/epimerase family protein n=1 Tax=unclassified Micromonospora TaxID=2617518 RepID=UPI003A865E59